ncbi:hypothetical protein S-PM2d209 [Synechococcus phage S-PM2]|uniref:Hypothetical-Protein / belonging to T4-LIKE GC: 15 n=1 Tax=Synechococcus phage S-PM2 TaxID=238854 RepID=Q5GQC8_BPSYP|nr:tail protein [Synechococcus phage S-PM2]CAF34274.1 Hypothetical-Protein / belonging to T4-LIKE GC: 15 [Synechococcus phage S-PM2]CFW42436.1 hypothetical protein S-PM2d209 [Synechococcus phage S-PM2]
MSNSKFFKPKKVTLTSVNGEQKNITALVGAFSYYENIYTPFVSANMFITDSGQNLIGTLPIQGGEKVVVRIENVKQEPVEYELFVWKIYNRKFERNMQMYNLALLSEEAMNNEAARVTEKYKAHPEIIVQDILKNVLKTKKNIQTETSKFKMSMFPNGRKAHAVIQSLMSRSVPKSAKFKKGVKSNNTKTFTSDLGGNATESSGTAGYLFFETKDGFVFKSMDLLCSDGTDAFGGDPPVATYISRPAVGAPSEQAFNTIEDYSFTDEIDIVEKLNNGIFSTHMCYFDLSTGKYEEYKYDMSKTFDNMSHLGSQDDLAKYQRQLGEKPSRIMTILLDHELWYNDEGIANPEEEGDAEFPDYAKYYTAQSIGRRYLMENQRVEITIPGNSDLMVGQKIKIMIPNMAAESIRKKQPYDEENSGTYLISQLSHNYQFQKESGEPEFTTRLALIRDTYGIKEYDSKVAT